MNPMKYARTLLFAGLSWLVLVGTAAAQMELIMVEEPGCIWCARWNDEISEIYPKTPEGRAAPLRRIDIRDRTPDDLSFARSLHFTPTFVLMLDGEEVSRIEGYPGEDFFWGLLTQMIDRAQELGAAG